MIKPITIDGIKEEMKFMKAVGIVISKEEIKTKLQEKGMSNLTGEALMQAKAQIILEIVNSKL